MTAPEQRLSGFGLGLRPQHFAEILSRDSSQAARSDPGIDWFEIITENFMGVGGAPMRNLERVRGSYPVVMHGVSLSIGGIDPLDEEYLAGIKDLAARIEPLVISDHLCWTGAHGVNLHDLNPLPMTQETIDHVCGRVGRVQDFLGRTILLENASTYVTFEADEMPEWTFLSAIARKSGCGILLDVNNIYVSSVNHGFSPSDYLAGIPVDRVRQIHLAGHQNNGDHLVDTHDAPVADPVWELYADAVRLFGTVPTMIERDDNIPPLAELAGELLRARQISGSAADTARSRRGASR